jgi:hypothetical protein
MSRLIKQWFPILTATLTGLVVLIGYLIPISPWTHYRDLMIKWAVIVAAFAFVLGIFNILRVHGGRAFRLRRGWLYSLALLLAAVAASIPPLLASDTLTHRAARGRAGRVGGLHASAGSIPTVARATQRGSCTVFTDRGFGTAGQHPYRGHRGAGRHPRLDCQRARYGWDARSVAGCRPGHGGHRPANPAGQRPPP